MLLWFELAKHAKRELGRIFLGPVEEETDSVVLGIICMFSKRWEPLGTTTEHYQPPASGRAARRCLGPNSKRFVASALYGSVLGVQSHDSPEPLLLTPSGRAAPGAAP